MSQCTSFGLAVVLIVWLPVILLAATIGVWLFYIQHQFEETYWQPRENWDFRAVALQGASFYDLPLALHWMTGNIGFHHIHHLASRIPNYRLRECHEANPPLRTVPRLTLWGSFRCAPSGALGCGRSSFDFFPNTTRHMTTQIHAYTRKFACSGFSTSTAFIYGSPDSSLASTITS